MNLSQKLKEDLKAALKASDSTQVGVLRFLLSEVQNKEKEKQAQGKPPELTDEETVQAIQKEFKRRKEAIELFKKGGREDLVQKEEAEIVIIGKYIPRELSPEEIKAIIDKLIADGIKDFNLLMKEGMKLMKGRADGRAVTELIKERLK